MSLRSNINWVSLEPIEAVFDVLGSLWGVCAKEFKFVGWNRVEFDLHLRFR